MIPRLRALALVAAALAVPALAGCTSTITGHGTMAADSGPVDPVDPPTQPPDDPTTDPSVDDPTADPGGGTPGSVTRTPDGQTNPVCEIFSDEDILAVFGEDVTVDAFVGDNSCQFKLTNGGFVIISHWEFLSVNDLAETAFGDVTEITFADRPALRADGEIMVSLGTSLDTAGAVDGSEALLDTDPTGELTVMPTLLEQAVHTFSNQ